MFEPTVSGQQNQRWQHFVLWDVVQRGYRVDEVKVVRIVRISIVRCPRPTYREVRKLQRGVSLMWLSRRIPALRRSRTPTSATAAPKVPSGARFTEAATSNPMVMQKTDEQDILSDNSRFRDVPPFEPPLIATLPFPAYLFLTSHSLRIIEVIQYPSPGASSREGYLRSRNEVVEAIDLHSDRI